MIELPIRTVNALNTREHWYKRFKRTKQERKTAYLVTPAGLSTPIVVKLTRIGPKLMDDDGVVASCKALRDGIADKIGVNDGSDQIKFEYAQEKAKRYAVRVEFLAGKRLGAV